MCNHSITADLGKKDASDISPSIYRLRIIALWLCSLSHLISLLLFVTLAVHLRMGLGHWPQPMIENYSTPLFNIHAMVVALVAGLTLILSLFVWWALTIWADTSRRDSLLQLGIYFCGWLLLILAAYSDPTTFTSWLLD